MALARVRDTARAVQTDLKPARGRRRRRTAGRAGRRRRGHENAERILEERELDVVWLSRDPRRGPVLRVAPMSVAMLVRDKVFADRTVVLTSATLELGGTFDAVAGTIGLRGEGAPAWQGLDVGSPFDYPSRRSPTWPAPPGARARRRCPESSTRSSSWSGPPVAARSGSSPRCAPRRPPQR